MEMGGKAKFKLLLIGFLIGIFVAMMGYLILGKNENSKDLKLMEEMTEIETESKILSANLEVTESEVVPAQVEETEEREEAKDSNSEIAVEQKQNKYSKEAEEEGKAGNKVEDYMVSSNMKISGAFVRELYLYQYIEYGLRKYNEEKQSDKDYSCNVKEDMLSYYAELGMKQEGAESFKTDLAKELLPELRNNLFNFCLHGEDGTLYMQIDTYDMKIYIYDKWDKKLSE